MLGRRGFIIVGTAGFVTFGVATPAKALWPLIGLFARAGLSTAARSAGSRIITRSATRALVRQGTRRSLSGQTKREAAEAERRMASGGFSRVINEVGGQVIEEIAVNAIARSSRGAETIAVQAENPYQDGIYGPAQCIATVTPNNGPRGTVLMETPEILALELLQEKLSIDGYRDEDIARIAYPVETLRKGNFNYAKGHEGPTILKTGEGTVTLRADVYNDLEGLIYARFDPRPGSTVPQYVIKDGVGQT
jgi:hypothetical protein